MIHRVYEKASSPGTVFSQRRFCGFCGTPLSFWSEAPHLEADYIRLALGSLYAQDLNRLDEWGAVIDGEDDEGDEGDKGDEGDDKDEQDEARRTGTPSSRSSSTGLPWLDRFVEGSRLDRQLLLQSRRSTAAAARIHRHDVGSATRPDGSVVEWEVVEWTEGEDDKDDKDDKVDKVDRDDRDDKDDAARHSTRNQPSPAKRQKHGDDGYGDDDIPA